MQRERERERARVLGVLFGLSAMAAAASVRADVCELDLVVDTANDGSSYEIYFGAVVDREHDDETGHVAVCVATREGPRESPSEPVLVAYVVGGEGGACATLDGERTCGDAGCDEVRVRTESSQNITVRRGRGGVSCVDSNELNDRVDITLGDAPLGWTMSVDNDGNGGWQGFTDSNPVCVVDTGSVSAIYYGRGGFFFGGLWYDANRMYVCSDDTHYCTYDDADLDSSSDSVVLEDDSAYGNIISNPGSWQYNCGAGGYDRVGVWNAAEWAASMEIWGGTGADVIVGSPNADVIYGGHGNDLIYGRAGDDRIWTDVASFDSLGGGTVYGEDGDDGLHGSASSDSLYGGNGDDYLYGYSGSDYLDGGAGNDTLYGGNGNDDLYGGAGNDTLYGNANYDYLNGGTDTDSCDGGSSGSSCPNGDCCEVPECEARTGCATQ